VSPDWLQTMGNLASSSPISRKLMSVAVSDGSTRTLPATQWMANRETSWADTEPEGEGMPSTWEVFQMPERSLMGPEVLLKPTLKTSTATSARASRVKITIRTTPEATPPF